MKQKLKDKERLLFILAISKNNDFLIHLVVANK